MLLIGFAEKFYTLWSYEKETTYTTTADGKHYETGVQHKYTYHKNISFDLDKVKEIYPNVDICEDLRGMVRSYDYGEKFNLPTEYFTFGRLVGQLISTATDVWQLQRLYTGSDVRRKVLARRRLVELGELIRYDWVDRVKISEREVVEECYTTTIYEYADKKMKYISKADFDYNMAKLTKEKAHEQKVQESCFLHNEGDKIVVIVKKIAQFGFDTSFGYCTIQTLQTETGETYTYKGNSPMQLENDTLYTIKGTVKHNTYNGVKQTLLQRVKLV